jgi:hypothetical protein
MVVDVMTDSTGYNNTIILNSYSPTINSTNNISCFYCVDGQTATLTYGNFYISLIKSSSGCSDNQCYCISQTFNYFGEPIENVCNFCFCVLCCINNHNICCTNCAILQVINSNDDFCCCMALTEGQCCCFEIINCYCYIWQGDNCWDFFCNNNCKCQIILDNYPTPTYSLYGTTCEHGVLYKCTKMLNPIVCIINGTTSYYNCTLLNGNYTNCNYCLFPIQYCELSFQVNHVNYTCCVGNFFGCITSCATGYRCIDLGYCSIINSFSPIYTKDFCFCLKYRLFAAACAYLDSSSSITYTGGYDDFCHSISSDCNTGEIIKCYCFVQLSNCCYNFYCNGVCKCQITLCEAPILNICIRGWSNGFACCGNTQIYTWFCGICQHLLQCTKLTTNIFNYNCSINTTYLSLENYGSGTIFYNIIS